MTYSDSTIPPALRQCSNRGDCVHIAGCLQPNDNNHFYINQKHQMQCRSCLACKRKDYRNRNREKVLARGRERYTNNREAMKTDALRRHYANREQANLKSRQYYQQNKERLKSASRHRFQVTMPNHKARAEASRRYRQRKRSFIATFTAAQWQACLEYFHHTCAYCGAQQDFWHVLEQEHVIPVTSGGGYIAENIVPSCKACNSSKHADAADTWLASKFSKRKAAEILARISAYFEWVKT